MKKSILLIFALFVSGILFSQVVKPVKWDVSIEKEGKNEFKLTYKADIEGVWHLYGTDIEEGGPVATNFNFVSDGIEVISTKSITKPEVKYDSNFLMEVPLFSHSAVFEQIIKVEKGINSIEGFVNFMACDDHQCLPPQDDEFILAIENSSSESLLWFFFVAFGLGFLAIFTPCVFPMIPMTVSFFMRETGLKGKLQALYFGASIVVLFVGLGIIGALVNNPNFAADLSTHWIANSIFFILFMVFAISFLGAFEIVLPSSLTNKSDQAADKGGILAPFFMALTTVLVSFSCTGPFIGGLFIQAVGENVLKPLVGMFGFGLAFALPFTLLAFFPSLMKKLPKSGGWMNVVKVFFAFIMLAFGLKFLSNIDQNYHFGLLSRELYLSIWIVLFSMLGAYFLGKIKFKHDSDLGFVSWFRTILAIASFSFSIYLFTGFLGNPLTTISPLLPPPSENTLISTVLVAENDPVNTENQKNNTLCADPKYSDIFHLPHGLVGYYDLEQGLKCAKESGKPAFVVFKGHSCSNCKKMESTVWADDEVLKKLNEKFVVIALYTDDKTKLADEDQYVSDYDGKKKKTIGKKASDIQMSKFNVNTIPYHVIYSSEGDVIDQLGVTFDADEFNDFLDKGINNVDIEENNVDDDGSNENTNSDIPKFESPLM